MIFSTDFDNSLILNDLLLGKITISSMYLSFFDFYNLKLFFFFGFFKISLFLASFLSYFLFGIKFYRVLCYTTLTLDILPLINPYIWPSSAIRAYTRPYFDYWSKWIPLIRIGNKKIDVSYLVALEAFQVAIFFIASLRQFFYVQSEVLYDKIYF